MASTAAAAATPKSQRATTTAAATTTPTSAGASSRAQGSRIPSTRASQQALGASQSRNQRQKSLRAAKDSTDDLQRRKSGKRKGSPQPSETSAGSRGGQQFRVGNIGNNGLIYLRPISRSSKASPQQLPMTPPQSAGEEDEDRGQEAPPIPAVAAPWRQSILSGTGTDTSTQPAADAKKRPRTPPSPGHSHPKPSLNQPLRSSSKVSTTHQGPLKIIIDRASPPGPAEHAPATAPADVEPGLYSRGFTLLDIDIPHYRLGAPRFTGRGSAFLTSSMNSSNGSEDPRSSNNVDISSNLSGLEDLFPSPPSKSHHFTYRTLSQISVPIHFDREKSERSSQKRSASADLLSLSTDAARQGRSSRARFRYSQQRDENFVRLSPVTGQLVSATPSQLITQITSPNSLDYELMTDFFLTYRSFMSPQALAQHLVMRLLWAFGRPDDYGRIIRVRTFVALRHWILNYFLEDFYLDIDLRNEFCTLINEACAELNLKSVNAAGDMKILDELKRGWRQECNKYWESPDMDSKLPPDEIYPGGLPEVRQLDDDSEHPSQDAGSDLAPPPAMTIGRQSPNPFLDMIHRARNSQPQRKAQLSQSTTSASKSALIHRDSDQSAYYISCSIPASVINRATGNSKNRPKEGPRPAMRSVTPRAAARAPPSAFKYKQHQRSGSFSDSQRDTRPQALKSPVPSYVPVEAIPGSLTRGAIYQPISPQVESVAPPSPTEERSPFELASTDPNELFAYGDYPPSGPGVRGIIGNVRRALSMGRVSRAASRSKSRERYSRPASAEPIPRTSAANNSHKGSTASRKRNAPLNGPARVDVLGVKAVESFKQAIRDDFETKSAKRQRLHSPSGSKRLSVPDLPSHTRVHSAITAGSRSIVIMNEAATQTISQVYSPPLPVAEEHPQSSLQQPLASSASPEILPERTISPLHREIDKVEDDELKKSQHSSSSTSQRSPPTSRIPVRRNASKTASPPLRKIASLQSGKSKLPVQKTSSARSRTKTLESQKSSGASSPASREPVRGLRRVPGGDLKGVENVQDLDTEDRSSSPSTATPFRSLAIPMRSSSNAFTQAVELEAQDKAFSLLDTHSSQPMMRPSFEAEVAKLAQLPDEPGVGDSQSALEKLEGRHRPSVDFSAEFFGYRTAGESPSSSTSGTLVRKPRHHTTAEDTFSAVDDAKTGSAPTSRSSKATSNFTPKRGHVPGQDSQASNFAQTQSLFAAESILSGDTYNSVPLLERGVSHHAQVRRSPTEASKRYNITGHTPKPSIDRTQLDDPTPGLAITTDETPRIDSAVLPDENSSEPVESFYLGDNESLSSLSTVGEPVTDNLTRSPDMRSFYDGDELSVNEELEALPSTGHQTPVARSIASPPPLPPPPTNISVDAYERHASARPSSRVANSRSSKSTISHKRPSKSKSAQELRNAPLSQEAHLPFVLAYDSLVLAQQLTLIERDALQEIEWRELIEVRWDPDPPTMRDWVDYLRSTDAVDSDSKGGVNLCIARFNLVVKWAISEVVLTLDSTERVATIVKFIHVAQNCRRLRNWATMYQLTTALVSADLARLKHTWALVPDDERETLKYLEALILPMRNFYNLRSEMESATARGNSNDLSTTGLNGACVPFVGIYTHDLIYNSQKPEFADPPPGYKGDEQFINFERYHSAANIVKGLLALIESSSRYGFRALPDVLARCLWMSALTDEEIASRAREIEEYDSAAMAATA